MAAARIRIVIPRVSGFESPVAPFVFVSLAAHVLFVIGWTLVPLFKPVPTFPKNAVAVSLVAAAPSRPKVAAPAPAAKPPPSVPKPGIRISERPVSKPKPLPEKIVPKKAETQQPKPAPANSAPSASDGDHETEAASTATGQEGGNSTGISAAAGGDIRFDWYRSAVTAALHSNWQRPVMQRQLEPYEVVVTFDIQLNGNVANLELAQSSGVQMLDRSAMRAVTAAQPLPPLPPAWKDALLPATYVFRLFPE